MRNALVLLTVLAPMSAFAVDDVPPKIWVDTTEALTETSDGNARADLIGAAGVSGPSPRDDVSERLTTGSMRPG